MEIPGRKLVSVPTDSQDYLKVLSAKLAEIEALVVLRKASNQTLTMPINIQQRMYLKGVVNALAQLVALKTHGLLFDMAPDACSFKRLIELKIIDGGRDGLWGAHTKIVLFSPQASGGFSAETQDDEAVRNNEALLHFNLKASKSFSQKQNEFFERFKQIESNVLCEKLSEWRNGYLAHHNAGFLHPNYAELCSEELSSYCDACLAMVGDFIQAVKPSISKEYRVAPWIGVMDQVLPTLAVRRGQEWLDS